MSNRVVATWFLSLLVFVIIPKILDFQKVSKFSKMSKNCWCWNLAAYKFGKIVADDVISRIFCCLSKVRGPTILIFSWTVFLFQCSKILILLVKSTRMIIREFVSFMLLFILSKVWSVPITHYIVVSVFTKILHSCLAVAFFKNSPRSSRGGFKSIEKKILGTVTRFFITQPSLCERMIAQGWWYGC